jgi:MFS family permease
MLTFGAVALTCLVAGLLVRRWWLVGAVLFLGATAVLFAAVTTDGFADDDTADWVLIAFAGLAAAALAALTAIGVAIGRRLHPPPDRRLAHRA